MITSVFLQILLRVLFLGSQTELKLEKEIPLQADYITVDHLENIYSIKGSQIRKMDYRNGKTKNYSNLTFGRIHSVDVSDPFKILVFYNDFNRIEFLDNYLSLTGSAISLDDLGYYHVTAACSSVNGGFWLFDQSLNQIAYVNQDLNTLKKSSILTEIIGQNTEQDQVFMLEKNDYIYLCIPGKGILTFDSYGTYIKTLPIQNNNGRFQIINRNLSYLNKGNLYFYNLDNYYTTSMALPLINVRSALIENRKLFVHDESKIYIYQLKNI